MMAFDPAKYPIFSSVLSAPFEDNIFNSFQTSRADYIMRYAEVLLTYAEASGRAGSVSADAWEALNQVRRRAEGLDDLAFIRYLVGRV